MFAPPFSDQVRTGLCIALCLYVYHQLKPACKLSGSEGTTASAATASSGGAVTGTTTAAADPASGSGSGSGGDAPLPAYLLSNSTYLGADSPYSLVPVPAVHRPHSLIYGALNQPRMIEGAWNFIKKKAKTAITGSAGAAASDAVNSKSDESGASGAVGSEYPEVVSVYQLGDRVSGHRNIVHGGLTAALVCFMLHHTNTICCWLASNRLVCLCVGVFCSWIKRWVSRRLCHSHQTVRLSQQI